MAIAYADDAQRPLPQGPCDLVCDVHVIQQASDLDRLIRAWADTFGEAAGDAWRELEAAAHAPTIFTSFAWTRHVIKHREDGLETAAIIAAIHDGQRLMALWPLALQRLGHLNVVTSLGAPFDQYAGTLIHGDADVERLMAEMVRAVRQRVRADGMVLRKAKTTGVLFRGMARDAQVIDAGAQAPQISFSTDAPFTDFMGTVNAKTRKNLRNYTNRLARLGALENKVVQGHHVADLIAESFATRRTWLNDKGLSSEAFRDSGFKAFVDGLAAAEHNDLGLIGFAMQLDGQPIALQWGFVYRGCYYAYLSSRDPAFESFSVGRIHLQHILEACHARGIGKLDLMVPAVPYKMSWTKHADDVVDLVVPWTLKGQLVLRGYEQHARPRLKAIAGRLPSPVRKRLFGWANQ
ncbi:MAG: GNAT family N-acetyltransferase [Pseudomonadota bacterium]